MDLRPFYEKALQETIATVAGVRADQLGDATPCSDWTVRDLLNHMVGGHKLFAACARGEAVGERGLDFVGDDHLEAFKTSADDALNAIREDGAMERIWALPFGEMPGAHGVRIMLLETVVHGWDVAKATGQTTEKNDLLAAQMLGGLKQMVPAGARTEGPFGSEVEVSDTASDVEKLVAYLGRQP